ncbi:Anaphase-promoting complex subunit 2 [Podila epigama]|nr:Anaphase-promoting complex subunit 2 [Podila epigama]
MIQAPSRYARVIRIVVPVAALCGLAYLFLETFLPNQYEAASLSISASASSLRSSLSKGGESVMDGYREISRKKEALMKLDILGTTEQDGNDGARTEGHRPHLHYHHHHHHKQQQQQQQHEQKPFQDTNQNDDEDTKIETSIVKGESELDSTLGDTDSDQDDDEPIYEVEKANGAFVMFTSEDQIQSSRQTIREMEDRFNRGRNYPWIILSVLPLTERSKSLTAQLTKGNMTFATVPRQHHRLPKGIDVGTYMAQDRELIFKGVNNKRTAVAVRNDWRYLSGFLAQHPLLDPFEFFWRVDPGLEIYCDIQDDPMLEMKKNQQTFGFSLSTTENGLGVPSAWKFVKEFKKTHSHILPTENSDFFLTRESGDEYTTCTFGVQNSIARVDFFRSPQYLEFIDAVDEQGLFYYEKFTDAIVITLALCTNEQPMNRNTADQWRAGIVIASGSNTSASRSHDHVAQPSNAFSREKTVFTRAMDPNSSIDPGVRRLGASLRTLMRQGFGAWAGNWILDTFRRDALSKLVPLLNDVEVQYQKHLQANYDEVEGQAWTVPIFRNVIQSIYNRLSISIQLTRLFDAEVRAMRMDPSLEVSGKFLAQFSAEIATHLPPSFDEVAHMYFEETFRLFEISTRHTLPESIEKNSGSLKTGSEQIQEEQHQRILGKKRRRLMQDGRAAMDLFVDDLDDEVVEEIFHGNTSSSEAEAMISQGQMQEYMTLCVQLDEFDFGARMTDVVTRMLYRKVEEKILTCFQRKWDVPTLESGKEWMIHVVLPFLRLTLLPKKDQADPKAIKRFKMWASRLEFYFFKTFGDLRIKEFFDIILGCPHSEPAVNDLKTCIGWTGQREQLQKALLAEMKHLRIFDPSGVMLDIAAKTINRYLRTRDDTMQAIVKSIVDDSNNLLDGSTEGIQAGIDAEEGSDDEATWVPEPANAGPDLTSARRKMADIISVLASIYDTNDRFIKEFQAILSERLLQATDFQVDREIRQLELLKLRFGEVDLHHCEVMLADIAESKRVTNNIQERNPSNVVNTVIASRFYWPAIEDNEEFELPEALKSLLESFVQEFEITRPAQKLEVFPSLGMVEIELEFEGRPAISMQVPPIQAAIIHLFEQQDTWSLSNLASQLQMAENALEPQMSFWIQQGLLKETSHQLYQLDENPS